MKYTLQTYKEVEYHELEKLIQETYNIKQFSIVSAEEERNDTVWACTITNESVDEHYSKRIKEWIDSKGAKDSYLTRHIMQDMCHKGIIEPGNYLINISW